MAQKIKSPTSVVTRLLTISASSMFCVVVGLFVLANAVAIMGMTSYSYSFFGGVICGLLALLGAVVVHVFFMGEHAGHEEAAVNKRLDNQTGLLSRIGLAEELPKFLDDKSGCGTVTSAYLIAVEFDSIKDIIEVHGHETGDSVIRILADRLRRIVGDLGPIARIDGGEFVLAIKAATNDRELKAAVDALIESMSHPIKFDGLSIAVFGNAGVVKLAQRSMTLETALRCATLARSSAREAGRGTWAIYHPEMSQMASYRKWLECELAAAIQRNELSLRYQPQVESETGRIIGYEALLRWLHHEKGSISPVDFISIAEQCGLIRVIGSWVLHRACLDAMRLPVDLTMSVNVSSGQIIDADFTNTLRRILQQTGLPPNRLELEVTESVVISDFATVRKRFAEIREIGCSIAIDDFGTGYSNLTNLAELPFQKLKIDKSFVDRMISQRNMSSIVRTIVDLGRSLGARVIAEGVEHPKERDMLHDAGCTLIQGYYYSKPLALNEALQLGSVIKRDEPSDSRDAKETADDAPVADLRPMVETRNPDTNPHPVPQNTDDHRSRPDVVSLRPVDFNDGTQRAVGTG